MSSPKKKPIAKPAAIHNPTIAVYPGTFDPITNGHVDIIKRAMQMFDRIIIVIATNATKKPLFSIDKRIEMIEQCFGSSNDRIEVKTTSGLIVDFAMENEACAIVPVSYTHLTLPTKRIV